jgi:flagellar protein FliS
MDQSARESYLEAQILTATPQKLRLLLIEGALRFARQALRNWEQADNEHACDAIARCRGIISELLASIRPDSSELTQRVTGLYLFLFRQLTEAQLRRQVNLVEEVIQILEIEHETWRQVCDQMPLAPISPAAASAPQEILAPSSWQESGALPSLSWEA